VSSASFAVPTVCAARALSLQHRGSGALTTMWPAIYSSEPIRPPGLLRPHTAPITPPNRVLIQTRPFRSPAIARSRTPRPGSTLLVLSEEFPLRSLPVEDCQA